MEKSKDAAELKSDTSSNEKVICVDHLTVVGTNDAEILKDVSFSLHAGERVAIIGENGAGKSTFLLSLVGIVSPSSGTISVGHTVLNKKNLAQIREKVGMVFQNPDDQLFMPNVYDDIAFGPRNMGASEEEINRRIEDVLEKLGISHLRNRMTSKLSGGEKRSIAIATILVMNPDVILFDEPTSYLDPKSRRLLIKELSSIGHTQLIATHDLDLAMEICDRVVILQKGEIQAEGPTKEILMNEELLKNCGLELPLGIESYRQRDEIK
ncbi:MAG: energy-coupling factor ABC transporter ATP-binding protein [Methanimicrococcus sp.]|nr:energy-coupling factor ABC transporter ATP-binding protein [Methanimicrococcus sp.]